MRIFLYIDESGSIHANSKTKYFAVGGFFVLENDKGKVVSIFKKINMAAKQNRKIDSRTELKSYDYLDNEKIKIFIETQNIETFIGCVKIFDKNKLPILIYDCNSFFNYSVYVLIKECIIPYLFFKYANEKYEFIINADDRNTGAKNKKDLEKSLNTIFCLHNCEFNVEYFNSAFNYGIQVADLIVNTFYNKYKDLSIVKNILPFIDNKKFIVM